MADVYGRTVEYGNAMKTEDLRVSLSNVTTEGLLLQNLTAAYRQGIGRLWELGSRKVYLISRPPEGTFTADAIVGPSELMSAFLSRYGDVCNADSNTLVVRYGGGWCSDGGGGTRSTSLHNVVLTEVDLRITAQDMTALERVAGVFVSMSH